MITTKRIAEIEEKVADLQKAKAKVRGLPWKRDISTIQTSNSVEVAQYGTPGDIRPQNMADLEFCLVACNTSLDDIVAELLAENKELRAAAPPGGAQQGSGKR